MLSGVLLVLATFASLLSVIAGCMWEERKEKPLASIAFLLALSTVLMAFFSGYLAR